MKGHFFELIILDLIPPPWPWLANERAFFIWNKDTQKTSQDLLGFPAGQPRQKMLLKTLLTPWLTYCTVQYSVPVSTEWKKQKNILRPEEQY